MEKKKVLAIKNVSVFKSTKENTMQNGVIIVEDDKIKEIGTSGSVDITETAEIIDGNKRFALPGLIDAHCHIAGMKTLDFLKEPLLTPIGVFYARAVKDLEKLANAGFTSVVDAGSVVGLHLRDAVKEDTIAGPRVFAAGYPLSITFGHGDMHSLPMEYVDARTSRLTSPLETLICDGEDECRKATRYALRSSPDFIKVMATGGVLSQKDRPEYRGFTLKEMSAIVEEAKAAGRFVHAHAHGKEGIVNALNSDVKVIGHATYLEEDVAELAKKKDAIVVPTFSIVNRILTEGGKMAVPEWGMRKSEEIFKAHIENIRRAWKIGVKIATGTDYGGGFTPHGENATELKIFVEKLGMTSKEAIISATSVASEATGMSHMLGTLEPGKLADLILVKGDPTKNINVLLDINNIELVMKGGVVVKNFNCLS